MIEAGLSERVLFGSGATKEHLTGVGHLAAELQKQGLYAEYGFSNDQQALDFKDAVLEYDGDVDLYGFGVHKNPHAVMKGRA
jgi:hypothetical protein